MIEAPDISTKNCPICAQQLPLSEFGVCRSRKDGRNLFGEPADGALLHIETNQLHQGHQQQQLGALGGAEAERQGQGQRHLPRHGSDEGGYVRAEYAVHPRADNSGVRFPDHERHPNSLRPYFPVSRIGRTT